MQTNSLCTCLKGDKGDTGSPGPRGQNGYNGTDGIDGQAGDRGVKGDPGIPGFNGDDGVDGEKGDRGLKGDAGAIGLHGLKGDKGTTGPKGDEGIPGAKGIVGPKGQKGEPYQRAVDTTIAFTAGVIQQPDMHDSRSIIFNMVYTNVGGAYNKETGRFTCTIAGLYVFTWSTEVNQSRYIKSQLTVNGQNRAYLQVSAGIFSNSGCATIILQLNINDVVDVTPSMFSHGASLGASSSFSGHLLYSI
ncbi:otolin-1-A-like [Mizuhopecten yessoensis]|uniref:otolin-1-A-like n=1 Tax=Mizuhopecten yessoensis TaxID=6573 RepID=UPI000B458C38|nr:otolin-1-A-like [Mizuhopecten yessoensis]